MLVLSTSRILNFGIPICSDNVGMKWALAAWILVRQSTWQLLRGGKILPWGWVHRLPSSTPGEVAQLLEY